MTISIDDAHVNILLWFLAEKVSATHLVLGQSIVNASSADSNNLVPFRMLSGLPSDGSMLNDYHPTKR